MTVSDTGEPPSPLLMLYSHRAGSGRVALVREITGNSNQDVLTLIAHGLPESIVLRAIEATENDFDVSSPVLQSLKRDGISNEMVEAMLRAKHL